MDQILSWYKLARLHQGQRSGTILHHLRISPRGITPEHISCKQDENQTLYFYLAQVLEGKGQSSSQNKNSAGGRVFSFLCSKGSSRTLKDRKVEEKENELGSKKKYQR